MRWRADVAGQDQHAASPRGGVDVAAGSPALRGLGRFAPLDDETRSGEEEPISVIGYLTLLLIILGVVRAARVPLDMATSKGASESPAEIQRSDLAKRGADRP